jgi:hypothetical protein
MFCVKNPGGEGVLVESVPSTTKKESDECFLFPHEGRVAHISLVFREMWDSTDVDR